MATDPMLDPDYKYSINKFTGNGSKTSWDLNFSGGYIRREHVKAYTQAADGQITELSFTWSGPNTIVITPPVANGVRLFVYRDTPKSGPLVDFTDGAIINEFDLDMMARQTVFATAEMVDRFADVAIESQEATATANEALVRAADAQDKVALSNSTSSAALLAAQGAVTTANTANANAVNAVGVAGAANATAGAANTKADTAIATANTALSNANAATGIANTAAGQSASAVTTAGAANSKADNAVTRALAAQDAAANATTIASGAEGTANNVASQFDALRDTVEEIAGGDLSNFVRVTQENTFIEKQTFSAGAVIGGVQWGGSGADAKIINAWGDLTGKPTSFPPTAHAHAVSDVTGLQGTLTSLSNGQAALTSGKASLGADVNFNTVALPENGLIYVGSGSVVARSGVDGSEKYWRFDKNGHFYALSGTVFVNGGQAVWHEGNLNWSDAVLQSTTNLGKTGGGPLVTLTNAALGTAPTGYSVMTNVGSQASPVGYGYLLKHGRRDNGNGYGASWVSHVTNAGDLPRVFFGAAPLGTDAPGWVEMARMGTPERPLVQDFYGTQRFINAGAPGLEIVNGVTNDAMRFGPAGGISFSVGGVWQNPYGNIKDFTFRNRDESFRDLTAQRGDGSGAIFLGGGSYIYHNTAGQYEFGGAKQVRMNENLVLTNGAGGRIYIGNGKQPRISVQATAPAAEMQEGDLWVW